MNALYKRIVNVLCGISITGMASVAWAQDAALDGEIVGGEQVAKPLSFAETRSQMQAEAKQATAEDSVRFLAGFVPSTATIAVDSWLKKAKKGDLSAMLVMSMMYHDGVAELKVDKHEWMRWILRLEGSEKLDYEDALFDLLELSHGPSLSKEPKTSKAGQKVVAWLETAAAVGYPNAEFVLGLAKYNGIASAKDEAAGVALIHRAAAHGLAAAQYYTAMMYELGIAGPVDKQRANAWLVMADEQDYPDAVFTLDIKKADGIDMSADPEWIKERSNLMEFPDMRECQHAWLEILNYGDFDAYCTEDYDSVNIWYRYEEHCGGEDEEEDDEDGNISEMENKRYWYSVDYALGRRWMRTIDTNDKNWTAIAVHALSVFDNCKGSREDDLDAEKVALQELKRLESQNAPEADYYLLSFYQNQYLDGDHAEENVNKIIHYYKRLADRGNNYAFYGLGLLNVLGVYDEVKYADASLENAYAYWSQTGENAAANVVAYTLATENRLGIEEHKFTPNVYNEDVVVEASLVNKKEAISWYIKSAEKGNWLAHYNLGNAYQTGDLTDKDLNKAIRYYETFIQTIDPRNNSYPSIDLNWLEYNLMFDHGIPCDKSRIYSDSNYIMRAVYTALLFLVRTYQNGGDGIKADGMKSRLYKIILSEILDKKDKFVDDDYDYDLKENEVAKQKEEALEKSIKGVGVISSEKLIEPYYETLKSALNAEIAKEIGKNKKSFWVYNSVIVPCMNEDKESCNKRLEPLFEESVVKVMTGITAFVNWNIKKQHLQISQTEKEDIILALYFKINQIWNSEWVDSVVMDELWHANISSVRLFPVETIKKIWLLRQVPYAVQALYMADEHADAEAWKQYLQSAEAEVRDSKYIQYVLSKRDVRTEWPYLKKQRDE